MIKSLLITIILFFSHLTSQAQFNTTPATTSKEIVEWLIGEGVTTFNIKTQGAVGFFNNGESSIGIKEGVILTSGTIENAEGPNDSGDITGINNAGGDSDLAQNLNEPASDLYDASVIEFDFIPYSDEISVNYVFASDEYPEFVCQGFNDGFAFLVSGPGIVGIQNIAQIPGTNIPVSINNVNDDTTSCGIGYAAYFVNNSLGTFNIEYDGFTTPLTASIEVIPCETYHIKLVIADVGDSLYDSGVMLQKGSFQSGSIDLETVSFSDRFQYAIEGCNNSAFIFRRSENLDSPLNLKLQISGTAINGLDYTEISDSLYFNVNQDSAIIVIEPIYDSISDPIEYVIISVLENCNNQNSSDTIYIRDFFDLADTSFKICEGQSIVLNDNYGFPSDQFIWTPYSGLSCNSCTSPVASPTETTKYFVHMTEPSSGCQGFDSVNLEVYKYPLTTIWGENISCNEPSSQLIATTQIVGELKYQWSYYDSIIPNTNTSELTITNNGDYKIITSNYDLCYDTSSVHFIEFVDVHVNAGGDQIITYGDVIPLNGTSNIQTNHIWTSNYPNTIYSPLNLYSFVEPKLTTEYILTDSLKGCIDSDTTVITVKLLIPNAISPNGDGLNDTWTIVGINEIEKHQISVHNRYGNVVYSSVESYIPWDGTRDNKPLPVGTYYYIIETTNDQTYSGSLTIMR